MSDYKTPKEKLITNEQALTLNECFKAKHEKVFGATNESGLCCSSWYSLEDLEGYINYVKEQAKEQEINVDGIRFYFGVYPDTEDESKAGHNTLFMCPTKSSVTLSASGRSRGEEDSDDNNDNSSEDVTTISAMNFGDGGNPPRNNYGG